MASFSTNSGDPDQTPHSAVSDLGLLCLQLTLFGVSRLQWVNALHLASRQHFEIVFLFFFQKSGSDISCKLLPLKTICMKCQILFSGKNKKNITNLLNAELAKSVVNFNV